MTHPGVAAKAAGIARIDLRPEGQPWRAVADAVLLDLARTGGPFTSEDVTRVAGQPGHPNAVGALLNAAARRGLIARVGFVQADRANQHGALISQWRGTAAAASAPAPSPQLVQPRRADAAPRPAPMWRCATCGTTSPTTPATGTVDARYREGACLTCRRRTTWRAIA